MRKILCLIFLILFLFSSSELSAKVYVTEPLLVQQPSYAGMNFYVYKPYNMPSGWYVTFDGYPVRKNKDNIWVYGTSEGPNLIATNYVVGSVVPSMAGLVPYMNDVQISELRKLPNTNFINVTQPNLPASNLTSSTTSTYIPDWSFNARFMAVGKWKSTVDRIAVLHEPAVPVAWKGDHPRIIYIWIGDQWYQVVKRNSETISGILKRETHIINRNLRRTKFQWYKQDMPVLAQQARAWGYYWFGEILAK